MADIRPRKGPRGTTYQLRYVDADGDLRYKSFKKRKDAAGFLSTSGNPEPVQPEPKKPDAYSLGAAIDDWLMVCEKIGRNGRPPVEAHTLRHYKSEADHLKALRDKSKEDTPLFAGLAVTDITGPVMVCIRDALLGAHSRHMARRCLTSLKSALSEAEQRGKLVGAPGRGVSIVMSSRDEEPETFPETSDVKALLKAGQELASHRDGRTSIAWKRYRPLMELLIFSGMRPSEVRGLPRRNVDPERSTIRVSQRADEMGTIGPPKTKAGFRTITIPKRVMALLVDHMKTIPDELDALVFANGNGNAESLANITNRCWRPLLEKAGLVKNGEPPFRLYDLRHHRASIEIDLGAKELDIKKLMGHESVKTTLDIYGHLFRKSESEQAQRAELLDELFATDSPQEHPEPDGAI